MAETFDFDRLRVTKDGDAYCVHLNDFVNLQESPAVFYDETSWQGRIIKEWWEATPLLHLPLVELLRVWRKLHQEEAGDG